MMPAGKGLGVEDVEVGKGEREDAAAKKEMEDNKHKEGNASVQYIPYLAPPSLLLSQDEKQSRRRRDRQTRGRTASDLNGNP